MSRTNASVLLYLRFVPVEAVVFVVVDCSPVALVVGQIRSFIENLLRHELIACHSLDHFAHSLSQSLPHLKRHISPGQRLSKCKHLSFTCQQFLKYCKVTSYLEVGADLQQQPSCSSDIIGGHQPPLEDGQRNIGTGGQIQICNWR